MHNSQAVNFIPRSVKYIVEPPTLIWPSLDQTTCWNVLNKMTYLWVIELFSCDNTKVKSKLTKICKNIKHRGIIRIIWLVLAVFCQSNLNVNNSSKKYFEISRENRSQNKTKMFLVGNRKFSIYNITSKILRNVRPSYPEFLNVTQL